MNKMHFICNAFLPIYMYVCSGCDRRGSKRSSVDTLINTQVLVHYNEIVMISML